MAHAENTVTVNRPPATVFDFLADCTNEKLWRDGIVEIELTSETNGVGATYRQVLAGPAGRRIPGDFRITEFEPLRRIVFEVTAGPARPTGVFELTDAGESQTRVRFALDVKPTGLMWAMTPVIARQMRREVAQLDKAKDVLEKQT